MPNGNTVTIGGDPSNIGYTDFTNPYDTGWAFAFGVNYYSWNGSGWIFYGWNLPSSFQQYAEIGGYSNYPRCYLYQNVSG